MWGAGSSTLWLPLPWCLWDSAGAEPLPLPRSGEAVLVSAYFLCEGELGAEPLPSLSATRPCVSVLTLLGAQKTQHTYPAPMLNPIGETAYHNKRLAGVQSPRTAKASQVQ